MISVTVLPRIGARAAHELFLTGEVFDARRAAESGLLNAAVPADELDATVERYVFSLSLGAPTALAATKELLQGETARTMPETFEKMQALSAQFFAGEEGQEAIAAFTENGLPNQFPNVPTSEDRESPWAHPCDGPTAVSRPGPRSADVRPDVPHAGPARAAHRRARCAPRGTT